MLAATVCVARMLGKNSYGELGMIQSTVGMLSIFAGFGLGLTATKYVAEFRVKDPHRVGRVIGLSGLFAAATGGAMAVCLIVFAPSLAERAINAPYLADSLRIGSVILFVGAVNGAQTGALSGLEAFKTVALVNLLVGLISFPVILVGTYFGGLSGTLWALAINLGFNWLLNHLALRKEAQRHAVPLTFTDCWQEWPILWNFSIPAVLSGILVGPVTWACNALLVNRPDGYAEMGVYSAALRIKDIPSMVLSMLMTPILPVLSDLYGRRATANYNRTLSYAFSMSLAVMIPVSLVQMAAPSLTLMPFGEDFSGHHAVVQWLMLQAMCLGLFTPMGHVLASMNRMWFGLAYNSVWAAVYLLLAWLLVPRHGASGLAAALATAHLATSLPCAAYIYVYERPFIANTPLARHSIEVGILLMMALLAYHFTRPLLAGTMCAALAGLYLVHVLRRTWAGNQRPARSGSCDQRQSEGSVAK